MTRDQRDQMDWALQYVRQTLDEERHAMSEGAYASMSAVIDNASIALEGADIVELCSYTGDVTYRKPGLGLYD